MYTTITLYSMEVKNLIELLHGQLEPYRFKLSRYDRILNENMLINVVSVGNNKNFQDSFLLYFK